MAYAILNTDGTTLLTLADKRIDQTTTSLTLVGKNYAGYGEYLNNNFIKLLANGASSGSNYPRNPLKGQLWYDTTAKRLKIFDESFKSVSGAILSSEPPADLIAGDIWFNYSTLQLYVVSNGSSHLVGPAYPQSTGEHGWIVPTPTVKDIDDNDKKVSPLKNYGHTIGYLSNEKFNISASPNYSYLTTATTSTVKGLTIFGDINFTGKSIDRYLTLNVNLDRISTYTEALNIVHIPIQNQKIVQLLNSVFPVNDVVYNKISISNTVSTTISVSTETGVMVGSEVKVICEFTSPPPGGYQVRRFVAIGGAHPSWTVSPEVSTSTGIVSVLYKD